jgi:hypothetical protein
MGQVIYSQLVNYYDYSEEFIAEYILTNKLTEYFKKSKLPKYFKKVNKNKGIILCCYQKIII